MMNVTSNMSKDDLSRIRIAIDTGKAYTKFCYRDKEGKDICDKFVSAIGLVSNNPMQATDNKVFRCDLLKDPYYIDIPELCDITPTSDNEKNGTGLSVSDNNHDREIVTLGACLSIVKVMKNHGVNRACVYVAIGAPITEYEKIRKERNAYFNSILPTDRWVECRYEGRTYQFIVKRSVVCPETVAAFVYNTGNDKGNILLVDIGGNNIQYVCSTNGVINFDRAKTFTAKGGVNTFARRIRMLMEQNQIEPVGTIVEITEWLANPKSIPGKYGNNWKERFKELVDAEKKTYFSQITGILDTVTGNFREEMLRGYKVCYTGGGSVLFKSEINVSGGITFDGNEYANVLGFYKMLS